MEFSAGREFGERGGDWEGRRYRIADSKPLGVGAGSSVYKAHDKLEGTTVAVKVIDRMEVDDEPERVRQLEREINICSKLKHPNIINLLDVVFEDDWVLLVIEFAGGGSLYSSVLAGPVSEQRAKQLFQQMLHAVAYCADAGVYHRDLKLENVVFSEGGAMVKLTDFGASKDSTVHSAPKTKVGTIAYMPPEIVDVSRAGSASTYDSKADLWSLGVILYVMVMQAYPFGFDGSKRDGGLAVAAVYRRIRQGFPAGLDSSSPPSGMTVELSELLTGLLNPDPVARWGVDKIRGCRWLSSLPEYRPVLPPAAPTREIRLPPREKPRLAGVYGSCGSLGFGSFPSFSGNDGLLSLSIPRDGIRAPGIAPGTSFESIGSLADGLNDGLALSDSPEMSDGPLSSGSQGLSISWELAATRGACAVPGPPVLSLYDDQLDD